MGNILKDSQIVTNSMLNFRPQGKRNVKRSIMGYQESLCKQ
jgi:hypothetical protein